VINRGHELCKSGDGLIHLVAGVRAASLDPGPPSFKLEPHDRSKGCFATVAAATLIDGQRPERIFVCEPGELLGLQMNLIRAQETAPSLRGVFGMLEVDATTPIRVELSWGWALGAARESR
jgi:hypothetical protein